MSSSSPPRHAAPRRSGIDDPLEPRRRPWLVALVLLVVAALVAAALVWRLGRETGLAGHATVTASSTQPGSSAANVVDTGSATSPGADWQSEGQTSGAWVGFAWGEAHTLRRVTIVRDALDRPGVTDGFLTFGDGSYLQVKLSTTLRETVVPLSPRSVDRLRFTVSAVASGARHASLSEIIVDTDTSAGDVVFDDSADGNESPRAVATAGPDHSDARPLLDGSGAAGAGGGGGDWTVDQPGGAWVQLDWSRPRELAGVELVGSAASAARLSSATLTFGDGTRLPIGAVLANPDRPTVVSFMPRVTRSIRLTLDRVQGAGPLALAELRTYRAGATPVRARSTAPPQTLPAGLACPAPGAGAPASGLVVRCPVTGSVVDGTVPFQVLAAAGYGTVTATVWPADGSLPGGAPVRATPDPSGAATLAVDVSSAPPGPVTVHFEASGAGKETRTVFFQLYRQVPPEAATDAVASSSAAGGRTLAYAEEFDHPLSLSRTGADADYAAAKPVIDNAQDFGDAIFADPAQGLNTPKVVDNRYLRIDVMPSPPDYADPQKWNRTHLGGLLASARPQGSGFAAQYGYFEARMLLPVAPGTWPAFWMLPTANLIGPPPLTAEIDALEHYGHDAQGACQSTHEYHNPGDSGVAQCGHRFDTDHSALSWHTYGVSITPTENIFYTDGNVVATAPQVQGGESPMFFLVNLALGGGWPVDLQAVQERATLYVDYIRVYV